MVHQLWRQFPKVQRQLLLLQPYLLKAAALPNQPIHTKILELLKSGGKLLRPGFFYLFSEFGDAKNTKHLRAGAAAVELLHLATLIHDDVIDDSPLRRGVKTIHTEYGQRNAIYAGDYLFTCYFNQVMLSTDDQAIFREHVSSMQQILVGELDQMALNFRQDATQADYFHEITGKTAVLFELACKQGAVLANSPESVQKLAPQIGRKIGQAYQVLDDILDYAGDTAKTQKPVLEDLKSGVYSLPLLMALSHNQTAFKPLLDKREHMSDEDVLTVRRLVLANQGITDAQAISTQLTAEAQALIAQLPASKARDNIAQLTNWLLTRNQ